MAAWTARFGAWQDEALWRLFGLNLVLLSLQAFGQSEGSLATYLAQMPVAYHLSSLTGLVLLLAGPRMITLAASTVACGTLVIQNLMGTHPRLAFVADEYLVDALIPGLGVLVFVVHGAKTLEGRALDDLRVALRCVAIAVMTCAAFAKLNTDFLDPELSCARLGERLGTRFGVPLPTRPLLVLGVEAAVPLALVLWPRIGLALTISLAAALGHLGPAAFNILLVGMGCLFLDDAHIAPIARTWKRWLVAGLALGFAAATYSRIVYDGPMGWWTFGVFEVALALCAAALGASLILERGRHRGQPFKAGTERGKGLRSYLVFALVLNGLTPYLGVKYRLSFAMLSNLRVDRVRSNHLLVPQFVQLRPTPHVDVRVAHAARGEAALDDLPPGLYTAPELLARLERLHGRGRSAYLEVEYGGDIRVVERSGVEPNFLKYLESLPQGRLFQKQLAGADAQICVH